jgi:hypothetical protein
MTKLFWPIYIIVFSVCAFTIGDYANEKLSRAQYISECISGFDDFKQYDMNVREMCSSSYDYIKESE